MTGCVQAQREDIVQEDDRIIPAGKTLKAFVKPVATVVKKYVDLWLQVHPAGQAALSDVCTDEKVNYMFQSGGGRRRDAEQYPDPNIMHPRRRSLLGQPRAASPATADALLR